MAKTATSSKRGTSEMVNEENHETVSQSFFRRKKQNMNAEK